MKYTEKQEHELHAQGWIICVLNMIWAMVPTPGYNGLSICVTILNTMACFYCWGVIRMKISTDNKKENNGKAEDSTDTEPPEE